MSAFWAVLEFSMCAIEIGLFYVFCNNMLGRNESYKNAAALIAGIAIALMIFIATCVSTYSQWKIIMFIFVSLAYSLTFFNGTRKKKIICTFIFIALLAFSDVLATVIITLTRNSMSWEVVLRGGIDRLALFGIARIITLSLITVAFQFKNKGDTSLPIKYWLIFLFLFSVVLVAVLLLMDVGFTVEGSEAFDRMMMIVCIALLAIYFSIYYIFYQICAQFEKQNEMNMLQYQNETIEKYILQKEDSDKMLKIMNHDLKHNIIIWKKFLESESYDAAIKSMAEYERVFDEEKLVDVNNDIANAIINQKMFTARKNSVKFIVKGGFHSDTVISQIDLCSLLGNTIDNALEATLQVLNEAERKIEMNIDRDKDFLFIKLQNNYEHEPIKKNDAFISEKKNRGKHGIGMVSIKHVVEKYEGSMQSTYQDKIFTLRVMLKAYVEKS